MLCVPVTAQERKMTELQKIGTNITNPAKTDEKLPVSLGANRKRHDNVTRQSHIIYKRFDV